MLLAHGEPSQSNHARTWIKLVLAAGIGGRGAVLLSVVTD